MSDDLKVLFAVALDEVEVLIARSYSSAGDIGSDHALAQAGLRDGASIVRDYLAHGETGVAFEHLLYMIKEPPLRVSERCEATLAAIARSLKHHGAT